jgi:hypothetical protein
METPATVTVPFLSAPTFGATAKFTVPLPLPVAPELIVIQDTLLVAVHAHPVPVVTETATGPPGAAILGEAGVAVNAHRSGKAAKPNPHVLFGLPPRGCANCFK